MAPRNNRPNTIPIPQPSHRLRNGTNTQPTTRKSEPGKMTNIVPMRVISKQNIPDPHHPKLELTHWLLTETGLENPEPDLAGLYLQQKHHGSAAILGRPYYSNTKSNHALLPPIILGCDWNVWRLYHNERYYMIMGRCSWADQQLEHIPEIIRYNIDTHPIGMPGPDDYPPFRY